MGEAPFIEEESPQVQALLEQAWAAESGRGLNQDKVLAATLYRQAGQMGSSEGYYRAALIHIPAESDRMRWNIAACLLSAASRLGHQQAAEMLEKVPSDTDREALECSEKENDEAIRNSLMSTEIELARFDLERYVEGLPLRKQAIVGLVRKLAPLYAVDVRLALAVASVESNFNSQALSPKMAMGVMQLIPATAERFNVRNPYDAEQNIRGGLAYLRWLARYYGGDLVRVIAAYNAGEKAVDLHGGIPPYRETVNYVARVLSFSGRAFSDLPPTGAGRR